jgi:drug/metabolite transporter (DMT)-like permease
MAAIALGLGAALCWGLADFLGGTRTKALTLALVLLVSQVTALVAIAIVIGAGAGGDAPTLGEVAPAIGAGAAQLVGISALYQALSIGTMSVIAPISASGAAAVPVLVGAATGEHPEPLQYAGIAAAFAGVGLATRAPESTAGPGASRQALLLAGVAAVGFGGFFVGMDAAVEDADPYWSLLAVRITACVMLGAALLAIRPRLGFDSRALPALALIGVLDVSANAFFALGTETGLLSVVSVLASLYPVATVLLARALLDERLVRIQAVGVVVALAGVALIATG